MRGRKIAYLSVALGLAVLLATGMKHRGKTIAFSTVAVGIVVLAGAGIIFSKDRILEKWYLRQLGTGGEAATKRALEMLARVGSEESLLKITEFHLHDFPDRHIPASFELIGVPLDAITVVHAIERRIGRQRAQAEMIRYMKNPKVQERTRLHFARIAIGATAPECLPDSQ